MTGVINRVDLAMPICLYKGKVISQFLRYQSKILQISFSPQEADINWAKTSSCMENFFYLKRYLYEILKSLLATVLSPNKLFRSDHYSI